MKQDPWICGNITGSSGVFRDKPGQLGGYSLRETAGATAVVRIYDNNSAASGVILATIGLAANASLDKEYKWGKRALNGLYVQVVSGAVEGCLLTN